MSNLRITGRTFAKESCYDVTMKKNDDITIINELKSACEKKCTK